jgi:hypothetical protein
MITSPTKLSRDPSLTAGIRRQGAGVALGAATRARGSGGGGTLAAQQWTRRFSYGRWDSYDDGMNVRRCLNVIPARIHPK